MTKERTALPDGKMRFEIANHVAQTAKLGAQTAEINQYIEYRFWVLMAVQLSAMGILFTLF